MSKSPIKAKAQKKKRNSKESNIPKRKYVKKNSKTIKDEENVKKRLRWKE